MDSYNLTPPEPPAASQGGNPAPYPPQGQPVYFGYPPPGSPVFQPAAPPPSAEEVRFLKKGLRRQTNRAVLIPLVFFVGGNLIAVVVLLLMQVFLLSRVETELYYSLSNLFANVGSYLIAAPLALLIGNMHTKHRMKDLLVRPQASGGFIAKWILIGFGGAYAVNYFFNFFFLFLQGLGVDLKAPSLVSGNSLLDGVVTFVFFALAAPFFEELMFRGGVLGSLRGYGEWFAIGISAMLFGLAHMNYQQMFYAAALGIFAGYLCCKAKSVWPAIGAHFALNVVGSIQSIAIGQIDLNALTQAEDFAKEMERIMANPAPYLLVFTLSFLCLGLCAAGVVLLIVELVKRRSALRLENGCPRLSGGQKLGAALTSPVMLVFLGLALVMTVLRAMGVV